MTINFSSDFSLSGSDVYPQAVATDSLGDTYVAGYYQGTLNVDSNPSHPPRYLKISTSTNGFVAKYSPTGALLWVYQIEANTVGSSFAEALAVKSDGSVYLAGSFSGTANFDPGVSNYTYAAPFGFADDAFVLELSPQGAFSSNSIRYFAANGGSVFTNLKFDAKSQTLYAAGSFQGSATYSGTTATLTSLSSSETDVMVLELNAGLGYVWGATGEDMGGYRPSIAVDGQGNVYATGGEFNNGNTSFLEKFNSNGTIVAKDEFGGAAEPYTDGVVVDSVGEVYIVGTFDDVLSLNFGQSVSLTNNGGAEPTSGSDVFLAKFDASLDIVWAREFGSTGFDWSNALAIDAADDLYLGGLIQGTAYFGTAPGSGNVVTRPTGANIQQAFLLKIDSNGKYLDSIVSSVLSTTNVAFPEVDEIAVSDPGHAELVGQTQRATPFGGQSYPAPPSGETTLFFGGFNVPVAEQPPTGPTPPTAPITPSPPTNNPPELLGAAPTEVITTVHHKRKLTKGYALYFSGMLDPSAAKVFTNYNVTQHKHGAKSTRVNVTSATYNASNETVTLILGGYIKNKPLQLTASGLVGLNGATVPQATTTL